jgi:hypothetical protein
MNQENKSQSDIQREFDTYIFRLLELIENMNNVRDGEYKESCDIFMELRKMFQQTRQQIIHTPIFTTMVRRAVRKSPEQKYLSELEKVNDNRYSRCERCSSIVKNSYMDKHMESKKCCMNHEAKFQSIKIGEVKDERIANRMIYASTFTFNLKKCGDMICQINNNIRYIIFPHLLERINSYTEEERKIQIRIIHRTDISQAYLECNDLYGNNREEIDWYKDDNGKWCENGKK